MWRNANNLVPPMQCRMSRCAERAAGTSGKLRAEDFDRFDRWRLREQFGRLRHERFGDWTSQVGLAAAFVDERVENTKGRRPKSQREPKGRRFFSFGEVEPSFKELRDVVLFAGLGFEAREQCKL